MACGKFHKRTKGNFGNFMKNLGKGAWNVVKKTGQVATELAPAIGTAIGTYYGNPMMGQQMGQVAQGIGRAIF